MARNVTFQVLRGLFANIPTLGNGELYFATDTGNLYAGNSGTNVQIGAGSGSLNVTQAVVDFGTPVIEETSVYATISVPWVTASSKLLVTIVEGQDHTADEIAAEQVIASVGSIVPGVNVELVLVAPNGATGKYLVNIEG